MLKQFRFETYLIDCCAPTLASLKTASLFNCSYSDIEDLISTVLSWNQKFSHFGLQLMILRLSEKGALIYIYRRSQLAKVLQSDEILRFLSRYGYETTPFVPGSEAHILYCLNRLKDRVPPEKCGFPHEIGVFLGYPLNDVEGFIENRGKNSICVGDWSVYSNKETALKIFARNRKCKDIYSRLFNNGSRSILQLTVAG